MVVSYSNHFGQAFARCRCVDHYPMDQGRPTCTGLRTEEPWPDPIARAPVYNRISCYGVGGGDESSFLRSCLLFDPFLCSFCFALPHWLIVRVPCVFFKVSGPGDLPGHKTMGMSPPIENTSVTTALTGLAGEGSVLALASPVLGVAK
jgi:hypothetical protein